MRSCKNHEEGIFCFLLLISLKQTPATAKNFEQILYPDLAIAIDWKKLHSLAFETKLDTQLRELQYKILNLIIFTNKRLHRFKMVDSPLSALIFNAEEESLEHLLYFCRSSSFFGNNCYLG